MNVIPVVSDDMKNVFQTKISDEAAVPRPHDGGFLKLCYNNTIKR